MPRSGAIYTLPEAAFVPNTPISSAAVNSDFSDIADALTDSLARNGQGGMLAVLPLDNTGFVYLTDPNTGMRRTAADEQAIKCGGVDVVEVTSTGATVNGDLEVTGDITIDGNPVNLIGEVRIWTAISAPAKWLVCDGSTKLRADYPDLWTFAAAEIALGNLLFTNGNGSTTFTLPDLRGRIPAGDDASAGRLTSTTMTPDGDTLGGIGGAQTKVLITGNLPAYTPTGTIAVAGTVPMSAGQAQPGSGTGVFVTASTTSITVTSQTFTGAAQGGTSTAFDKIQPTLVINFILYAGA